MINIKNLDEMGHFAKTLAKQLKVKDVILLNGDLGAGKTTLTQFIGKSLGIQRNINSPTFNIIKSYQGTDVKLHHMDCYRLEGTDEDLGFDEYFEDNAVIIIEWSEFIAEFLPAEYITIEIHAISEHERTITLEACGAHYQEIKEAVERELSID